MKLLLITLITLTSCSSAQKNCDAYGSVENNHPVINENAYIINGDTLATENI